MPTPRANDPLSQPLPRHAVPRPELERHLDLVGPGGLGLVVSVRRVRQVHPAAAVGRRPCRRPRGGPGPGCRPRRRGGARSRPRRGGSAGRAGHRRLDRGPRRERRLDPRHTLRRRPARRARELLRGPGPRHRGPARTVEPSGREGPGRPGDPVTGHGSMRRQHPSRPTVDVATTATRRTAGRAARYRPRLPGGRGRTAPDRGVRA